MSGQGPVPLALAPAMADALARWLDSERALRGRSDHTITAYQADLLAFLRFLGEYHGTPALPRALAGLTQDTDRGVALTATYVLRLREARGTDTGTESPR